MGFFSPVVSDVIKVLAVGSFLATVFGAEWRSTQALEAMRERIGNPDLPLIGSFWSAGPHLRACLNRPGGRELYDAYLYEMVGIWKISGRALLVVLPVYLLSYL